MKHSKFTENVVSLVYFIPKSKVSYYGAIAIQAGSPGGAQAVVSVLKKYGSFENFPWYRVVSKSGRISIKTPKKALLQKELLLQENVHIDEKYKIINFQNHLWLPKNL